MSEDKKVKLDELPDEGSEPQKIKSPPKTSSPDPRLKEFKKLSSEKKISTMEQTWTFDVPVWSFDWVIPLVVLGALEVKQVFRPLLAELERAKSDEFIIGVDFIIPLLEVVAQFLIHPLGLVLLFPLFWKLRKPSEYFFVVKFDGIETVREFLPYGSKKNVQRVLLKWNEIGSVEKKSVNGKEILSLSSRAGHFADIIWYIDNEKKRALRVLLNGMLLPDHPLRLFIEKEKDLV